MSGASRTYHLIIADDEVLTGLALERFLSRKGFRVSAVQDGQRALDLHGRDPADLLITDLRMPRLPGLELVSRIRSANPDLPVVISTGYVANEADVREDARTILMTKPVDPLHLLAAVQRLLAVKPEAA
ncbi:MAG: transcriptional regulatory protein PrrA [Pseudomonadota bacterium]|jgi:DNA-binding response OmpR family regulator